LYTAADFELDERHVIKNEKVALDRLRVRQNVFLVALTLTEVVKTVSTEVLLCCMYFNNANSTYINALHQIFPRPSTFAQTAHDPRCTMRSNDVSFEVF